MRSRPRTICDSGAFSWPWGMHPNLCVSTVFADSPGFPSCTVCVSARLGLKLSDFDGLARRMAVSRSLVLLT